MKGTEESHRRVDSSVPLTHHDPTDVGLVCLLKKRKIDFRILSDLRIQHTVRLIVYHLLGKTGWSTVVVKGTP